MTLGTVSRYDPDRVSPVGDHAVVVGASMAGLLAGRVLADGFERVTILERDPLPGDSVARRGVPQGNHVHILLEAGRAILEDLFPGYGEDLASAGGVLLDVPRDLDYYQKGDFLAKGSERVQMYCASRPLIEHLVRRRLDDHDGVDVRPERHVGDFLVDDAGTTVEGVELADETRLSADLVVDATGRTSRTPSRLEELGYRPPPTDEVTVDLAYSTTALERPPDDRRSFVIAPAPPQTRGGVVVPVEGDRWLVTLFGLHGDHPPTDADQLKEFARGLPSPELAQLLDAHPSVADGIEHYPFPSNVWRHYEQLDRFPEGLVVTGDAIASFNPIYGQGMSASALEALELHHTLAENGRTDLAPRFFDRAAEVVDIIWRMAVGADFEFPQTAGPKPRGTDVFNRYLDRLIRHAHTDAKLAEEFFRVIRLEQHPTTLLSPGVVWRVLAPPTLRR